MIVGGQPTTDDSQDDVSIVEQLIHTVATLRANQAMFQAKVETLETRLSSMTVDNRKLFSIKLCFAVCTGNLLT